MFAYCGNNPVYNADATGRRYEISTRISCQLTVMMALVAAGTVILLGTTIRNSTTSIEVAINSTQNTLKNEVYDYARAVKDELVEVSKKIPNVHHIVPVGVFSNRSSETQKRLEEMHGILAEADINRWIDPNNLTLVSAGTHASLHTDAYIEHVYSYIAPAAGNKEAIYAALFYLRIEIAAYDTFASGY